MPGAVDVFKERREAVKRRRAMLTAFIILVITDLLLVAAVYMPLFRHRKK